MVRATGREPRRKFNHYHCGCNVIYGTIKDKP
jgi:hypothetical protein